MPLALQAAVAAASIAAAHVDVTERADGFDIVATYRYATAPDTARFTIIDLPGSELSFSGPIDAVRLGAHWLITGGGEPDGAVRFSYRTAHLSRLPLPVPTVPAASGTRQVLIDLRLRPGTIPSPESFPRFAPSAEGHRALLANVPSLIQLPQQSTPWLRYLEAAVLLLIALAALAWNRLRPLSAP
ncbi:MAG: hypothetical protein FJ206_03010 [Gemmatimonadetes bacterium]|nr:hypothetical protein [Gemmatimonadota bacterium]